VAAAESLGMRRRDRPLFQVRHSAGMP
jgi:hypothetical protein